MRLHPSANCNILGPLWSPHQRWNKVCHVSARPSVSPTVSGYNLKRAVIALPLYFIRLCTAHLAAGWGSLRDTLTPELVPLSSHGGGRQMPWRRGVRGRLKRGLIAFKCVMSVSHTPRFIAEPSDRTQGR